MLNSSNKSTCSTDIMPHFYEAPCLQRYDTCDIPQVNILKKVKRVSMILWPLSLVRQGLRIRTAMYTLESFVTRIRGEVSECT